MMRMPFILGVISSLCLSTTLVVAVDWSKPGCPSKCGNITIPYPFGIGSHCRFNSSFEITCTKDSTTGVEVPFLNIISMEVHNCSVHGTVIVKNPVTPMICSDMQDTQSMVRSLDKTPFSISSRHNLLVVLGCRNSVRLYPNTTTPGGGCMAICDHSSIDNSCNGVNCCRITIPPQLKGLNYTYQGTNQVATNESSCGYAFPVEKVWFQDEYKRYKGLQNNLLNPFDKEFESAPLVLEWELDISKFSDPNICANYFKTTSPNTSSFPSQIEYASSIQEYASSIQYCYCRGGHEGNPYIPGGCIDIDECSDPKLNLCRSINATCKNNKGGYWCEYTNYKVKKSQVAKITVISGGTVLGALILFFAAWKSITKKIKAKRKLKFFKQNGGLLLQQKLSSNDNSLEKTNLFGSKELAQATDRYNENRVLGRGGQGTVYKGMLTDGRIVAVKKSIKVEEGDVELFINEVLILSQINHRNVVKLLGCCLETEAPLLVYEFIPNGTLFQHVHNSNEEFPLTWEMRVSIAREVAGALSYLHSSASAPIYHRDIKSTNILLDDKYRAKVADFGTSRSIGIDQTHLTTRVLGTFGYLDPEYFQSSQFTDKSDVYSFGVVVVELLTGEKGYIVN
ncbi:PREDICTED: wall-associated receptor kinase-like 6 [Erythranthe guttata]|uniref:wall-associated receptor kinase-like 6 n=1 Tax=Erythranthe guttata TaxID=4155 RepID=UPI00064DA885|nr:PREDICTED: wall-associated receptor kinase-like 6 [Erythranthe guttata]|eukprot:XP_012848334.1 PREDICTED: wall-associated receptor kinase-like 6 [Erythranthe guttata]